MTSTTLYIPGDSFLHRLDPRTKLAWIVFALASAFILNNPLVPLIVVALLAAITIRAVGMRYFRMPLVQVVIIALLTIPIGHGFANPIGHTQVMAGSLGIRLPFFGPLTWEGLYLGVIYALRVTSGAAAGLMFILTTKPGDLIDSVTKLGVPFQYAFMLGMALQMIPLMQREAGLIVQAQRARALQEDNLAQKVKALAPIFVPLAVGAMQRTETTAMVLEARAFGAPVKRTEMHTLEMRWLDWLALCLGVALITGLIALRVRYGGLSWIDAARSVPGLFFPPQVLGR